MLNKLRKKWLQLIIKNLLFIIIITTIVFCSKKRKLVKKMTKVTTLQDYSRDFKDQLSQKVLQRIEKRYLSSNELTDAELKAFSLAERSQ